jgi:hypothetical protein
MSFVPQSAMQRIQVGLIGLVSVLLFVSIASMIFDQTSPNAGSSQAAAKSGQNMEQAAPSRDEPLAELGVAPAVADQEAAAKQAPPPPPPSR